MNASSVRPHTRFAAAMVAAGMVSAASIVGVPEHQGHPMINADVANASAITDFLYGIGDAVNAAATGVSWAFDGAFTLPFDGLAAIAAAVRNPELSPNVLSWLVQRYVNPSDDYELWSYPWEIKANSIEPLLDLWPNSAWIVDGLNTISDAINNALAVGLANPVTGEEAAAEFWGTDIGRIVNAANLAVVAPVWMLYNTAYYLGYLPAELEATFESAIQDPSEIPGLVSNLVYGLLSPTPFNGGEYPGLLGDLLGNISAPFTTLPGPIGELATNLVAAVSVGLNNVLKLLPAPISPTPFPTPQAPEPENRVALVPSTSFQVAGGIAVSESVEKQVETTDSVKTPEEPTAETPPVAPQDPGPAAGDVDPGATPAADTDTPEVKPGKPVTNRTKLGNKVRPGDKFTGPAKGDTGKDNDATAPDPVKDGPSDPTGPTGPEGGNADGPDNAGGADSDSGAAA